MFFTVINELDGLAQGSKTGQYDSEEHARKVKNRAKATIDYLEQEFETKNSHLKAQTSKGSVLETISFRSEETDKTVSPSQYKHRNDPKFLDRQVWANSVDPDQTAPREAVWSGSTLFAIPCASFGFITLW